MIWVTNILAGIAGIGSLVCFILVLIRMFQAGQTGLGIVCIVLAFCLGIGSLIAFIMGWVNARRWGVTNVMTIWTVCIVVGIASAGLQFALAPPAPDPTLPV